MYDYLIGTGIMGIVFLFFYVARKDLRKVMIYNGLYCITFLTISFILLRLFLYNPSRAISPGYWSPPTLFNLNHRTGGLGIEDELFMFFGGGIAAAIYGVVLRLRMTVRSDNKLRRGYALLFGMCGALIIYLISSLSGIYLLISLQFFGAAAIMWQRVDLIRHCLIAGFLFLILYSSFFYLFNLLFPSFVGNYYILNGTSHFFFLGVPLEEYLYALSFGMLWAPLYEYEHRLKDKKMVSTKR